MNTNVEEKGDEIVVFRKFENYIDANIARSKLDAFGVPCFLTEENIASLYPAPQALPIHIRLHIFKKDVNEVSSILMEVHGAGSDADPRCPKCGSNRLERAFPRILSERPLTSLMVVFFGILMPHKKINHCLNCDNEF